MKDLISIAIPIFNETHGIPELIDKTIQLALHKEIIIIDDGSSHLQTKELLSAVKRKYPQIILLRNNTNIGKSASIQKALQEAKGNIFVILDGDSELNPKDIEVLYEMLKSKKVRLATGVRVLYSRDLPSSYSYGITCGAKKIFGWLVRVLYGQKICDILSGFKMFYTVDFKNHVFQSKRFGLETELMIETVQHKRPFAEVDVKYTPRSYKEGKTINFSDGVEIFRFMFIKSDLFNNPKIKSTGLLFLGIILVLITFRIYTFSANSSPTTDSIPNTFTAVNILYQHRLDLTNFLPYFERKQITNYVGLKNKHGTFYSKTPVINGILSVPFLYVFDKLHGIHTMTADAFMNHDYETYYQSAGKYYASILAAASVLMVFLTLYALSGNLGYSILVSLIYGLGSMVYSTAAQANWQHAPSLLLITCSLYFYLKYIQNRRRWYVIWIAILLSISALIRITNSLFFFAIIAMLLSAKQSRKEALYSAVVFISIFILWTTGMSVFFHTPGGYNDEIISSFRNFNIISTLQVFCSLLVSPNVGMLRFFPFSLFGILGAVVLIVRCFQEEITPHNKILKFYVAAALGFLFLLLFNSFWWAWEGGYSYGPRLLIEGIPSLVYLSVLFFSVPRKWYVQAVLYTAICYILIVGLVIHTAAVFAYDTDWQDKYYKGRTRLDMAWYNNPNIIAYHLFVKNSFFTLNILHRDGKLMIEKRFYTWDQRSLSIRLLHTEDTLL